ncbi:MAG: response regulator, partial [Clostridia bacterium]|nr:response regulator [Clostridia bacterium]
ERENGTGLGMPIVKKLITMMNGDISIESKVGEGTTVTVLLSYPVAHESIQQDDEPVFDDTILSNKRILLCEDNPLNAQIATRLLKKKGIIIELAENGEIGTKMFAASAQGYYAAILMDIRMPIMNGFEATKVIRAMERADAKTIPIIAMTADAFSEDVKATKRVGMDKHLSKPIDASQMYATLAEVFRERTLENQED